MNPALGALVAEDLRVTPGPVLQQATAWLAHSPGDPVARLDAVLAALLAGEPRRALALIAQTPTGALAPGVIERLDLWARLLEASWYPGDVGGENESGLPTPPALPPAAVPLADLLDWLLAVGPIAMGSRRYNIEMLLRRNLTGSVGEIVDPTLAQLDALGGWAAQQGLGALTGWAALAAADLERRAARDPRRRLAHARALCTDPAQLAQTFLEEGDWWATPGSSPEALGWDLAPSDLPPPASSNPAAASACWGQAHQVLGGLTPPPRLAAALALRRSLLARLTGDGAARLRELDLALALAEQAGDGAGATLLVAHRLVADVEHGAVAEHAVALGGGWVEPTTGPVARILRWSTEVGSPSWCAGLGRLLERTGQACLQGGSPTRARVAWLAAIALERPALPLASLVLTIQLAQLDTALNLTAQAQLRLERAAAGVLADPLDTAATALVVRMNAVGALVAALERRAVGPAALQVAERLERLRGQLEAIVAAIAPRVPAPDGALPTNPASLQVAMHSLATQDTLDAQLTGIEQSMVLMQQVALDQARATLATLAASIPRARARAALQLGRAEEAQRWGDRAVELAKGPGVDPVLLPVTLVASGRLDRAREVLRQRWEDGVLSPALVAPLALRAEDPELAATAMARRFATGDPPQSWEDWLDKAEVDLGAGHVAAARDVLERAILTFEAGIGELLRDPDRLDACDQPAVAALYVTHARTLLAAGVAAGAGGGAGAVALETAQAALGSVERLRLLADVPGLDGDASSHVQVRMWQRAAAQHASVAKEVLHGLSAGSARAARAAASDGPAAPDGPAASDGPATSDGPAASDVSAAAEHAAASEGPAVSPGTRPGFADLDAAEAALVRSEQELERARPGILLRRAAPAPPLAVGALRERMPAHAVVLDYVIGGSDLVAWAVARDGVRATTARIPARELAPLVRSYHRACASGAVVGASREAERLAALLLDPFAEELAAHSRVVVVPFGPLTLVPFHALWHRGVPLGVSHVVSTSLRLGAALAPGLDDPVRHARPLLVGDPAFDATWWPELPRLPGSRAEVETAAGLLGAPAGDVLVAEAATEAAVTARLPGSDLVHLSSHGRFDELSPFSSSLVLAERDELQVAELAGERLSADLAVVTGCDTGRGAATLGGDLVGLSRSLLRAGVRRAVVSLWPVDDGVAPLLVRGFYERLRTGVAPALALAEAGRALRALGPTELATAVAALGADVAGSRGVRRGVGHAAGHGARDGARHGVPRGASRGMGRLAPLHPDFEDEEEDPEPAGGDAERCWASFVVVG